MFVPELWRGVQCPEHVRLVGKTSSLPTTWRFLFGSIVMSTKEQLEQKYKAYLAAVSEGRLDGDTLSGFVADQCIFNGNHFNPKQYGEYVANVTNRCHSGLQFNLVDVVIDAASGRLASKLSVSGKPKEEFFGLRATGRSVTFKEVSLIK